MSVRLLERWMRLCLFPLAIIFVASTSAAQSILDVPCLFDTIFGTTCWGCGVKSAIALLLTGNWSQAVSLNLLVLPIAVSLAWTSAGAFHEFNRGDVSDG